MKIVTFLLFVQLLIAVKGSAQNQNQLADSFKLPLNRIDHEMKIPCQFEVKFQKRENGKPFFITNDSAQLEFDFFKLSSVPFSNPGMTILKTADSYYRDLLQRNDTLKAMNVSKTTENKADAYYVYKIQDQIGAFYQLIAREGSTFFSIKIFGGNLPQEIQLDKLKLLYRLNKN